MILYEHIYDYFDRNKLFHPSLHGYRKGRSTMTALLSMYDKWVLAASKGQVSGVVLVDLSAAFDLVTPSLLIQKLRVYGFEEDIATWMSNYLTDRYQSVWIDHVYSDFLEKIFGVLQDSAGQVAEIGTILSNKFETIALLFFVFAAQPNMTLR